MDTGMKSSRLDRHRAGSIPLAAILVLATGASAVAQEAGESAPAKRSVTITPRVSVTETLTNNVRLVSVGQQSEQITEISPGIRVNVDGARLKSYFDYSLSQVIYAQSSSPSRTQNALTTFGTLEAVDNWAFLDFSGSISQQAISAFGPQSLNNTSINANRAEVSSYRISPYVRGALGSWANYEARYSRSTTSSDSAASDLTSDDATVRVGSSSSFQKLGWFAFANQQNVDYSTGRPTESGRVSVGLTYAVTPQLSLSANAGRESNNFTSLDKQSYGTNGVGVTWSPSQRTKFSAARDKRSFGNTHDVRFEHRTARTAWSFTDSKGISNTPNQLGVVSLGSVFDLLFNQFATLEPDPIARAQLVNAYLQANGMSPNFVVTNSFLTSALSLQRTQNLSFALLGVRDTITFIATRSESSRLDTISTGGDDFDTSPLIRQHGFSVNYAHRLTPNYSLGVLASQQTTAGQTTAGSTSGLDTTLRSLNVNVTGKVSKQATATVGARHVVSSSSANPYTETAVTGNLNVQF